MTRDRQQPVFSVGPSPVAAPPDRSPWRLVRRGLRRLRAVSRAPSVEVFAPLVVRGLGAAVLLLAVAYLGERERETSLHGPVLGQVPIRSRSGTSDPPSLAPSSGYSPEGVPGASPVFGALGPSFSASPSAPRLTTQLGSGAGPAPESAGSGALVPPCRAVEPPGRPKGITEEGKVILNEATAEELMTLRGIGQKRADDIVALRGRLGRFRKISDLLRIRGIGPKSLVSLKDAVVLDRPPSVAPSPEAAPGGAPVGGTEGPPLEPPAEQKSVSRDPS